MSDSQKRHNMIGAAASINRARVKIIQTCRNYTDDQSRFSTLTAEHHFLHVLYLQMAQAIASSDESVFAVATSVLKNNAQALTDITNSIMVMVEDGDAVTSIVNDIGTAAKFIGTL